MKYFKVSIGTTSRKGQFQQLTERYVKTELPEFRMQMDFSKQYAGLDVSIVEFKEVEFEELAAPKESATTQISKNTDASRFPKSTRKQYGVYQGFLNDDEKEIKAQKDDAYSVYQNLDYKLRANIAERIREMDCVEYLDPSDITLDGRKFIANRVKLKLTVINEFFSEDK